MHDPKQIDKSNQFREHHAKLAGCQGGQRISLRASIIRRVQLPQTQVHDPRWEGLTVRLNCDFDDAVRFYCDQQLFN